MYISSQFEPFNFLINELLGESGLLAFEPVIAGGFASALFFELKKVRSAEDWKKLAKNISKNSFAALSTEFGDIDFFFLGDSPIWQSEHRSLVADYLPSKATNAADNPFGLVAPKVNYFNSWGATYIKKQSTREIPYQLMRQPYFSVEACLGTFDLMTPCIAWHSGKLIFHEAFEDAFDRKEVAVNPPGFIRILQADIYTRLFTSLRIFKYSHRLGFSLSDELIDFCCDTEREARSLDLNSESPLRNIKGEQTSNPVPASAAFQQVLQKFLEYRQK